MAERILGPQGSKRRKRFLWVPMLLVACTALFVVAGAQAVHDNGTYQLDGNAKVADNSTPPEPAATEDADNICAKFAVVDALNHSGPNCNVGSAAALAALPAATSSTRAAFVTDGAGPWPASTATDDQYTGGSGDTQDVSSWKFKTASSSNDKSDIQNAFFAEYTKTIGGVSHKLAYFGGTRSSNNGDENTAFWLFQQKVSENGDNPDGTCSKASGCGFTGLHTPGIPGADSCYEIRPGVGVNINANSPATVPCTESASETDQKGDVFVVSAFTSGGKQPNTQVYVWMGFNGNKGAINPKSGLCVTSDCNILQVFDSASPGCDPLQANDIACAITNQPIATGSVGNTIPTPSPWLFKDVDGTTGAFEAGDYFEAGVDLTALGLGGECTSTFTMNTRSSQSVSASLQDLAIGQVGSCTSGTQTTPKISTDGGANYGNVPAGGVTIPTTASGSPAIKVKDHADITVQGTSGSFGGTVKFSLCGPLALDSTSNCTTGGVVITAAAAVNGSGGAASVDSDAATLTSVGRYCWRADYSGDPSKNIPGSSDPPGPAGTDPNSECFLINPVTPTLTTQATCTPLTNGSCILGAVLSDTATLSGTANAPGTNGVGGAETIAPGSINATNAAAAGGTITWNAYNSSDCNTVVAGPFTATVSGDNTYPTTTPNPVHFTPTVVGTYVFVATYGGNSPNTKAPSTTATCASPGDNETITVIGKVTSSSAQRWLPNDRVVLTGDAPLTGSGSITLYTGDNCGVTSGSAVSGQSYPFTIPNTNTLKTVVEQTNNTTFFVGTNADGTAGGAAGDYSWKVVYDDANQTDPATLCEKSNVTITD